MRPSDLMSRFRWGDPPSSSNPPSDAVRSRFRHEAPAVFLIALTFAVLTAWSWRKWPDLLVDFGGELYVPWQLSEGKVLYRDMAWLHGPLSPYLNALWFRLFGVSLTTLICANLSILAGATVLIYATFRTFCGRFASTLTVLVFLFVFAFSQYLWIGNYNFVCPNTHALVHGVVLGIGMIFLLSTYSRSRNIVLLLLAGLCLGLSFLTKPELFLATVSVAVTFLFVSARAVGRGDRGSLKPVCLFGIGAILPPVLAFVCFREHMPAGEAWEAVGGAWSPLLTSRIHSNPFHLWGTGLDEPWKNLAVMFRTLGLECLCVLGAAVMDRLSSGWRRSRPWPARRGGLVALAGTALFAALVHSSSRIPWDALFRPLPILTLGMWVGSVAAVRKRGEDTEASCRHIVPALWSAFACVLLGKMALNARIVHYGYVLAMPATLAVVAFLVSKMPEMLRKLGGEGDLFRATGIAFVLALILACAGRSDAFYSLKTFEIGRAGDRIKVFAPEVDIRTWAVAELLRRIEEQMPPDATLTVLPEGLIINYWTRRANPTRYPYLIPTDIEVAGGEAVILESFKLSPPDYIVLIHKDMGEYGVGFFGKDPRYGLDLMEWVNGHYTAEDRILDEPLQDGRFGIKLLKLAKESR